VTTGATHELTTRSGKRDRSGAESGTGPLLDGQAEKSPDLAISDLSRFRFSKQLGMVSPELRGTFLCCLWSFKRIFVRAASGRQRFNVLGAWNAVTHELIAVTNTTVVNTETMCELLRKIADLGLTGPITMVLDNARYQRNAVVQALATQLEITLLYLPSYSPNLNLIERLWKFIKRRALYGRYHPTFPEFQAAIQEVINGLSTTHAESLKSLMTLNFQRFEDVSLMAA